jgi:hypothetical protein
MNLQHTFIVNCPVKFTIVKCFNRGGAPLFWDAEIQTQSFCFFHTKDKEPSLTAFYTNTCSLAISTWYVQKMYIHVYI